MKTATMNLTTKEFSGKITDATKSVLLMFNSQIRDF